MSLCAAAMVSVVAACSSDSTGSPSTALGSSSDAPDTGPFETPPLPYVDALDETPTDGAAQAHCIACVTTKCSSEWSACAAAPDGNCANILFCVDGCYTFFPDAGSDPAFANCVSDCFSGLDGGAPMTALTSDCLAMGGPCFSACGLDTI